MGNVYSQHIVDPNTKQWATLVTGASYNDLADQPVINAVGKTSETFVNMAGLEYGHYSLTGYYKEDSTGDVEQAEHILDVVVMPDEVTGKKVVVYPTVENGEYIINIITYENSLVISHVKQRPGASYWKPM